jgi:hypothetical protein
MLAALRHLEQRTGNSADPLPPVAPTEAMARQADDVSDMAVLDVPPTILTVVEFAGSAGFVVSQAAQPVFVSNAYTADMPATAEAPTAASDPPVIAETHSQATRSKTPLSDIPFNAKPLKPAVEMAQPLPLHDPYDPYELEQTGGPYQSDWSYRADRPTVEHKRSTAVAPENPVEIDEPSIESPISVAEPLPIVAQRAVEEASATIPVPEKTPLPELALQTTSSVDLEEKPNAAKSADGPAPTTDPKRVQLPASDPESSTLYRRLCGRLLATHPKRDPNASTVAMFVAPVVIGQHEFSLVELAWAAVETISGRLLLVAADPQSEFLPAALLTGGSRGASDVWRGLADWKDAAQASNDPRIDVAGWGTGDSGSVSGPLSWDGVRSAYELVLVAGSSEITPAVERLAPTCDAVVIVVSLGITGQNDALLATRRLAAIGAPLAGCVVTGVA